jgi:hypothetical protein
MIGEHLLLRIDVFFLQEFFYQTKELDNYLLEAQQKILANILQRLFQNAGPLNKKIIVMYFIKTFL